MICREPLSSSVFLHVFSLILLLAADTQHLGQENDILGRTDSRASPFATRRSANLFSDLPIGRLVNESIHEDFLTKLGRKDGKLRDRERMTARISTLVRANVNC